MACNRAPPRAPLTLDIAVAGPLTPSEEGSDGYATLLGDLLDEPLLRVAPDGTLAPALATGLEKLADGTVRFQLRPGATFSDGAPVTPEDVARALSANDLRVELSAGSLTVSSKIPGGAVSGLLGASVRRARGEERLGAGPFELVERSREQLVLRRRTPVDGRINAVRLTSYGSPREAMARVLVGDANALLRLEARDVELFEGIGRLQVIRGPAPHLVALAMNPRTLSREERLAIARALPIAELSQTAFGDACAPAPRASAGGALPAGRQLQLAAPTHDAALSKLGLAVYRALGPRAELRRESVAELVGGLESGQYISR